MENASKALIIAGAILISILLISVGIMVMNSTGNVTDQVEDQAESMAIQQFNAQFTAYEGSGRSASQLRALHAAMQASNAANPTHTINWAGTAAASAVNGTLYSVTLGYSGGYVSTITIAP